MKIQGRLRDGSEIYIPEEYKDKINSETMVVHLTPYRSSQDLYVQSVDYARVIKVRNASGGQIDCYYTVEAQPL